MSWNSSRHIGTTLDGEPQRSVEPGSMDSREHRAEASHALAEAKASGSSFEKIL
jgi:hypothetical protein